MCSILRFKASTFSVKQRNTLAHGKGYGRTKERMQ
uniref:Uncharacterized protein n=1 Tax=Arundo donax TaxID=35708 RepID=A0A0A9BSX7_ARUDO